MKMIIENDAHASAVLSNDIARNCLLSLSETESGETLTRIAQLTGHKLHEVNYRVTLLRKAKLVYRTGKASHMDIYALTDLGNECFQRRLPNHRRAAVAPMVALLKSVPLARPETALLSTENHQIADLLLQAAQLLRKLAGALNKLEQEAA